MVVGFDEGVTLCIARLPHRSTKDTERLHDSAKSVYDTVHWYRTARPVLSSNTAKPKHAPSSAFSHNGFANRQQSHNRSKQVTELY